MQMRRGARWEWRLALPAGLTAGLVAAAVGRVYAAWGSLPARMASHFDASGRPDGWSRPSDFFSTFAIVFGALLAALLTASACARFVPTEYLNVPHRDHWLAPERRDETLRRLGRFIAWLAVGLAGLVFAMADIVIRANVAEGSKPGPRSFLGLMLGFLGFVAVWSLLLWRGFRRPG